MGERFRVPEPVVKVPPKKFSCVKCAHYAEGEPGKLPETCRIGPPVLMVGNGGITGVWPPTEGHRWCSKYERNTDMLDT